MSDADKSWYHGVKWYWRDVEGMRTLAPGVLILGDGIGCGGPWGDEIDARHAELIAAAPETATERDALKARVAELEGRAFELKAALCMPDAERRIFYLSKLLREVGHFNRSCLIKAFGISTPQASHDIRNWLSLYGDTASYNPRSKRYERAAIARAEGE